MPASNNTLFYMFQNLAPAREYEVSVAMRNAVGEGPRAYVKIKTPPLPTRKCKIRVRLFVHIAYIHLMFIRIYWFFSAVPSQQPILILGSEHNIFAAPANDMLSVPVELYRTEHNITGINFKINWYIPFLIF